MAGAMERFKRAIEDEEGQEFHPEINLSEAEEEEMEAENEPSGDIIVVVLKDLNFGFSELVR